MNPQWMKSRPSVPVLPRVLLAIVLFAASATVAVAQDKAKSDVSATVPTISADHGDCTAAFDVRDGDGKPMYQASIHALVRWGLAHKSDLTVSTNYYGKAQFTGLPNYSKKPIQFDVTSGDRKRTVYFDPSDQCHAQYSVALR